MHMCLYEYDFVVKYINWCMSSIMSKILRPHKDTKLL